MHTTLSRTADLLLPGGIRLGLTGLCRCQPLRALARGLTAWREVHLLRNALDLAGQPNSILDLPCGTGRLWPLLLEKSNRMLIGADDCADMLAVAQTTYPTGRQFRYLQTSAFAIDLPDSAVDCIFCVRLFPLVRSTVHRQQILREFHRVTRDTLILSLWVDGNVQNWRRQAAARREQPAGSIPASRQVVDKKQIEAEFATTGFDMLGSLDFLPLFQMARTYVLRKQ